MFRLQQNIESNQLKIEKEASTLQTQQLLWQEREKGMVIRAEAAEHLASSAILEKKNMFNLYNEERKKEKMSCEKVIEDLRMNYMTQMKEERTKASALVSNNNLATMETKQQSNQIIETALSSIDSMEKEMAANNKELQTMKLYQEKMKNAVDIAEQESKKMKTKCNTMEKLMSCAAVDKKNTGVHIEALKDQLHTALEDKKCLEQLIETTAKQKNAENKNKTENEKKKKNKNNFIESSMLKTNKILIKKLNTQIVTLKEQLLVAKTQECVCVPCTKCIALQRTEPELTFELLQTEEILPIQKVTNEISTNTDTDKKEKEKKIDFKFELLQTEEILPIPKQTAEMSTNTEQVLKDLTSNYKIRLAQREQVIEKQAVWRKKHLKIEMELVKSLHLSRIERKVIVQERDAALVAMNVQTDSARNREIAMNEEIAMKELEKKDTEGKKETFYNVELCDVGLQTDVIEEEKEEKETKMTETTTLISIESCPVVIEEKEMLHMTETTTLLSIASDPVAVEATNTLNMTETTTLISIESIPVMKNETNEEEIKEKEKGEAAVLRHAMRKLQEELSQVRIEYDTEFGLGARSTRGTSASSQDVQQKLSASKSPSSRARVVLGELSVQ